jgi:hypothetical protein
VSVIRCLVSLIACLVSLIMRPGERYCAFGEFHVQSGFNHDCEFNQCVQ